MDVFEAVKARRSIRRFKNQPVPEEKLLKVLEAARLAPSAGNRQPWQFVVVRNPSRKRMIAQAADGQDFIAEAGAVIVALGDPAISKRWYLRDPMIAVEHMVLEAVELGLGTCWIGAFDEAEVKNILKIPESLSVVCILPVGLPDEAPAARSRRPFAQVFHKEEYGIPYQPQ
ncbi:MAG: nitroreductase family protein [Candidatus Bathyarchaeia archaeon]